LKGTFSLRGSPAAADRDLASLAAVAHVLLSCGGFPGAIFGRGSAPAGWFSRISFFSGGFADFPPAACCFFSVSEIRFRSSQRRGRSLQ